MRFWSFPVSSHKIRHLYNRFTTFYRHTLFVIDPFFLEFVYFLSVSILGFCLLLLTKPRVDYNGVKPTKIDLFFTSISATTTSSMSVIEMEFFSNTQLLILTFLMFVGGDIFISIVALQCSISKLKEENKPRNLSSISTSRRMEISGVEVINDLEKSDAENVSENLLKYKSSRLLFYVVIGYFLVNHILGFILIPIYLAIFPKTKDVLKRRSLNLFTFVLFTTVSSFTNCGFIPTHGNMIVFKKNSGFLLILMSQILLGNTLYPPCLRFCVWVVGKFFKKAEAKYLLESGRKEIRYFHWLSAWHSMMLLFTVIGLFLVQFVMFGCMEWKSEGLRELNNYERVIGVLFQVVNTRYSGESILDLWKLSPAVWVLFLFMMYIPPYTSYLGTNNKEKKKRKRKRKKKKRMVDELLFSPLSYIVIFIILSCIAERKKMEDDPLNFNSLSIVIEVVSAYGNVGFSKGYNCDAQLKPDANCVSKWYGFSGRWSNKGKFILIVTMFFGRLKKYHLNEGKAWKLM